MSAAPTLLDPLSFRLRGRALVEASAGTGKTFTIAALYLRLVLGHGGDNAFTSALTPPQILVVTFTEAATKELRDRIRTRLAQAAQLFLQEPHEPPGDIDPLLLDLRASYPPAEWAACGQRLRVAAEWMDEAAVSTIHGWCNRMLREHAFDSGSLFHQELLADAGELREEALRDYWREHFYPLAPEDAACVAGWWPDPPALGEALQDLLPHAESLPDAPPPLDAMRQAREACDQALGDMRAPYASWCEELQHLLDAARDAGALDGKKLQKRWYDAWLAELRAWCQGDKHRPELTATAWERLSVKGLREAWAQAPAHDALRDLEKLQERLGCLPEAKHQVLAHAARWVAQRIAREKQRRAEVGFDDMLTQLRDALQGGNGARLAERIRAQFPVALIDEFQDTDPIQYGIFDAVYGSDAARQDTALVLIGDPKQAIYAFRGADIFTYLQARRATAGRHETLGTNFRSTSAMVEAVNHVFLQAEQRPGEGAFKFRTDTDDPLPFIPVQAKGREQAWVVQDETQPALTCWWHDPGKAVKDSEYRLAMAQACAAEIVRLLNLGQAGQAGFREADGSLRKLAPRDIAVLVNGRTEARAVREALRVLGVRSVYLSDQGNVYASAAAEELQRLLQACASPEDGRLVRAALGTPLLAQDWQALDRLNTDELHWDAMLQRFRGYRERWRRQGVLPMLRRLLHDYQVPARLVAQDEERQLTDLLHLAELLQEASALIDGEHALVRFLAEQRQDRASLEQRQLRLESDADLLKVVTVHKSKGLEYPLVFVPFPCIAWPARADKLPLKWHDEQGRLHVSVEPDGTMVEIAERERLGEDLRKLYVALTRARFATWIGLAPGEDLRHSAVGYLLHGGQEVASGALQPLLAATFGRNPHVAVVKAPAAGSEPYRPEHEPVLLSEPRVARTPRERWWIASYSRLRDEQGAARPVLPAPESAADETYLESGVSADADATASAASPGTLHAFPAGAAEGTLLHGILEWAGRKGFAAALAAPDELAQQVARRTQPQRWQPHRQVVQDWLAAWLAAPWDLSGLQRGVAPIAPRAMTAIQVEMEFWLGASDVDVQALDAIVCRHTLGGVQQRPPLKREHVNGMLKGFIDLVFEHEGRYYVADYKSNRLGTGDSAYDPDRMRDAVLHHRYDLQYALYLFALHRLLRSRLGDAYSYDTHIGGAVYVFLRGHAAPSGGLHLEKPPRALVDELDALFGAGASA
ncbi:MAG TPA: exodeoxyribonuclease V subunit beta [Ramlibacter sp.]|nr:exodeoxyribonuclease V subunit beta [Ramlibacter sp.]